MEHAITVNVIINAPIEKVWDCFTNPQHIPHWAFASSDWEAPFAENDLRVGGMFKTRMQAKDGSAGFDFGGTYTDVVPHEKIAYTMGDGRTVQTEFVHTEHGVEVAQTFQTEYENTDEKQRAGWQAILDTFKKYVESI